MKKYDSILKEKKKYEETTTKDNSYKKFPWFKIDILLICLLLTIAYSIYYTAILTPKMLFYNDIKLLIGKYENILSPLKTNKLNDDFGIIGSIKLNDKNHDFEIDKINRETNFILSIDNQSLNYYSDFNDNYLKLANNEFFYKINNNDYLNMIFNIKDYFTNLSNDKFIKKFYLSGITPIVESNLVLDNNDIIEALKPNYYNSTYQLLFIFKNNAITNEIINMKIIINNLMTNERSVLFYENNYLTYRNDVLNLKLELEEDDNNFSLKIYNDDILHSILTGVSQESMYQYVYQIIDKIYNINVNINKENEFYNFDINYTIEDNNMENSLNVNFQYLDPVIDNDINNSINYSSLTSEEKELYMITIENITRELSEFIKKIKIDKS